MEKLENTRSCVRCISSMYRSFWPLILKQTVIWIAMSNYFLSYTQIIKPWPMTDAKRKPCGIGIVSVMTNTHITILMAFSLCQSWQIHILLFWWHCVSDDRYTYYYSGDIVSVMTDTHITFLMTLCQRWQIHTLLFWWHCVSDDR